MGSPWWSAPECILATRNADVFEIDSGQPQSLPSPQVMPVQEWNLPGR